MKLKGKATICLVLLLAMSLTVIMPAHAADLTEAEKQASALKQLKLFKGVSDTDFDLDRAPTRTEALVMLIRVLGKEPEALNGNWSHPFTDVASWANKYVGYAYEKGLTKGVSATEFGAGDANSNMYLTLMLRALGYNDAAGDFAWNDPGALAKSVGILPSGVDTANFLRADVVLVSWAALEANLKEVSWAGSRTVAENLMSAGVLTAENYRSAKQIAGGKESQPLGEGETIVSTLAALQAAVESPKISVINIGSDIDITGKMSFERDTDVMINIQKGSILTVSGEFIPVGCSITNDGAITVNGTFDRGLCSFINNGSVTVKSGGTVSSGVSNTDNHGTFTVDTGGKLLIERGSAFKNLGALTNNGYISIKDGGSVDNKSGSIINNGTIDLETYFEGDITKITGTGTLTDNRK